jgi:hypothetical protein
MPAKKTRFKIRFILLAGMSTFLAFFCAAQNIRVRAISLKDGRPLSERRVQLYSAYDFDPSTKRAVIFNKWAYTNGDGVATFDTEGVIPPHAHVSVGWIAPDWCSPVVYSIDEVLQKGTSIARGCPHRNVKKFVVSPTPGEIVLYFAEYSKLERMLYLPWPD